MAAKTPEQVRTECPYCGKICKDYHPDLCDFNPDVQKRMKDLIGLTFSVQNLYVRVTEEVPGRVQNLYVRVTEVVPGMEKPIMATILTYEKKNDELTASVQSARLHYASVIDRDYLDSSEYNDVANSLIEDLKRSMI